MGKLTRSLIMKISKGKVKHLFPVVLDVTDLLYHAQAKNVPGMLELDADFIDSARLFAPDDVSYQVIVLLQNGDGNPADSNWQKNFMPIFHG